MCFGLWGPRARDILAPLTRDDVSDAAFPYLTAREISVGSVPLLALRVTYVGELGWELYAPTEYGRALWSTLWEAGRAHGMVAGGYRAIDALRLEKGYRVWSSDITPDETPYEAGLGFAVALDKAQPSLARDALVAAKAAGPRKRLRCLVLDDPLDVCLGNEPVRVDGEVVGRVTSGGQGFAVERSIAYAYLPPDGRHRHARGGRGVRPVGRFRGHAGTALRPGQRAHPIVTRVASATPGRRSSARPRRRHGGRTAWSGRRGDATGEASAHGLRRTAVEVGWVDPRLRLGRVGVLLGDRVQPGRVVVLDRRVSTLPRMASATSLTE